MAKVFLRAYNREIETMIDRGQLDEAIAHCHHILKTFPKHLETYRLLGKAYLEGKRYGDAVDIFSRIIASVPNDFVAHVGMSIIRDEENKLDDAIWHMERAFEVQPSNAAIQSELQRLYGRRDGVQPPRIRMTRGALAHMYVQGELYPQAISEIKSVLSEDPGRSDMQALLARAYFKSGAKNDAVDAALVLLQRYPYSIDANRVLAEVLSADRNENAQSYRQRVVELDPYAGQVSGSIFLSNEVSEAAVALERLDWNGQPVGMQDWREQQAISPESGTSRGEQPDWMSSPFGETAPPQPTTGSMFDMPASSPAQPADEIPDFMKAAGWGESTGAFDESKPIFAEQEPAGPVQPIAEGDLPDWVKAMKPAEPETATPAEAEELPDWINQIGTGALSASTAEQSDWPGQPEQTSQSFAAPSGDEPDWLKGFGEAQEPAQASQDQPDWLKGFGSETESAAQPAESDTPDWLKGLGEEPQTADASAIDGFDWLQGVGSEPESTLEPAQAETPDWLKGTESAPAAEADNLDWLKAIGDAESAPQPAATETPDWLKATEAETASATDDLDWLKGSGESESQPAAESSAADLDWLQGIGEEADITPQPAQVETPDWLKGIGEPEPESAPAGEADDEWLKQFGSSSEAAAPVSEAGESKDLDFLNELTQEPVLQTPEEATRPTSSVEDLGKSTQEQDDSFAWLESLAAKQGASEGLLTKPEERLEYEPEWVKQAKGLTGEVPSAQPAASVEELGKSAQEQDDSFAWLESLAAKQGASEGLLTKPEERMEQEPEWVRQAKGLTAVPASQTPANVAELGKSTKEQDDSFAWLENLAAKQGATEGLLTKPEERMQEEPEWVKQAKSAPVEPPVAQDPAEMEELGKSEQEKDDSFAWLENLAAQQGASEGLLTEPEERLQEDLDWVEQSTAQAETPVSQPESKVEELGTSEQERDDAFAWLESLAAKHGASEGLLTKPEERLEQEPEWVRQSKDIEAQELTEIPAAPSEPIEEPVAEQPREEQPVIEQPASASDTGIWLQRLVEEEKTRPEPAADETEIWLRSLEGRETEPAQSAAEPVESELPAWMENIEQDETLATEAAAPERMETPLQESAEDSGLPSWLSDLEKEEQVKVPSNADDLPAWLRDETGDVVAEPVKIEPTRPSDWKPAEEKQPEIVYSPPLEEPQQPPVIYSPPLEETPQPEPVASVEAPQEQEPVAVPVEEQPKLDREPAGEVPAGPGAEPYREPVTTSRGTGMPVMAAAIDQTLGNARSEFSRSNIPGGLDLYAKLIKKGRFLDEVIYDLREALYRFPVEVNIWQALGDAYMRANRLQDALDAYTKAEELLR